MEDILRRNILQRHLPEKDNLDEITTKLAWNLKCSTIKLRGWDFRQAISFKTNVKDYDVFPRLANLVSDSFVARTEDIPRRNDEIAKLYFKAIGDINPDFDSIINAVEHITYEPIVMIHNKVYYTQVHVIANSRTHNLSYTRVANNLDKAEFRFVGKQPKNLVSNQPIRFHDSNAREAYFSKLATSAQQNS